MNKILIKIKDFFKSKKIEKNNLSLDENIYKRFTVQDLI